MFALAALAVDFGDGFRGADDSLWVQDVEQRRNVVEIFDPFLQTDNPFRNSYYEPLQSLIFRCALGLGEETGGRLLRWLVALAHLANGFLLYLLICRFHHVSDRDQQGAAALGAALFLVYPPNIQTSRWISASMSHVILLFLLLLCWHFFSSFQARRGSFQGAPFATASLVTFVAAGLIKETAVLAPLGMVCLVLEAKARDSSVAIGKDISIIAASVAVAFLVIAVQATIFPDGSVAREWGGVDIWRAPHRGVELLTQMPLPIHQPLALKLSLVCVFFGASAWILGHARRAPLLAGLLLVGIVSIAPFSIHNFNAPETLNRYLYIPSATILPLLVFVSWNSALLGIPGRLATPLRWMVLGLVPVFGAVALAYSI